MSSRLMVSVINDLPRCNRMQSGGEEREPRVDAQADFGKASGYFVRLDLRPSDTETLHAGDDWAFIALDAEEAEVLGRRLIEMAQRTRENTSRWKSPGD
jgi:hypothetical protein